MEIQLKTFKLFAYTIAAPTALAVSSPAALAQDGPPPASAPAADVSQPQLRSFARAIVDLNAIHQELGPQIETAPEAEKPALQQQAQARMTAAVEQHDLDPQTFNQISAAVEQNPQLAQQVRNYIHEETTAR